MKFLFRYFLSPGIHTNLYVYLPRVGFVILSVGYFPSLLRDLIRGERQREKHKILLNIFREKISKTYFQKNIHNNLREFENFNFFEKSREIIRRKMEKFKREE